MRPIFQHATLATLLIFVTFFVHAKTASEVYEQAAKSTVIVENIDARGKVLSMGSGVVFTGGDVVTNCHVIKDAIRLKVHSGAKEYPATLRYSDWDRDICSLRIIGLNAPAIVVGNTKKLKVGTKVYAIGAPKGLSLTLSDGIVSSLREVDGGHYIQTTAAISPGSSGGGLFDENGTLVGLTTFYLAEGQNLNFAVPVEWVNELVKRSTSVETTATATAYPMTQWLNKSFELDNRNDWPALLEHTRRWTEQHPNNGIAWGNLGYSYNKAGQSVKAIEAYQQALRINPEHAAAWINLGNAYANTGQSAKAIEAYQQTLRINPEYADAWFNLGNAYKKTNQSAKAIEAYQQALVINP
jgi:Trypsin-like peptidase domain/Tetratricopeptide repeat